MSALSKRYYCGLCEEEEPNRKYRKAILGDSVKQPLSILDTFSRSVFPNENLSQTLKSLAPNRQYLCRSCIGQCTKFHKLKQELEEVTTTLNGNLGTLYGAGETDEEPPPQALTTPKRPRTNTGVSPAVEVVVKGKGRPVKRKILQPLRRHAIKHLSRGNITLAIRDILTDEEGTNKIAVYLAKKIRDVELKTVRTMENLSSLRHYHQVGTFTNFSWDELWKEIQDTLPTLSMHILHLIPPHKRQLLIPTICIICGIIAKANNQQLNVIQDMLSIVLYGGRTTSMTIEMLQPMLLTVSRKTLNRLVDSFSNAHDEEVLTWSLDLTQMLHASQVTWEQPLGIHRRMLESTSPVIILDRTTDTTMDSSSLLESILNMSTTTINTESTLMLYEGNPLDTSRIIPLPTITSTPERGNVSIISQASSIPTPQSSIYATQSKWNGFKLVGDNLDKNIHPRHQTSERQTKSLHLFHYYAVHDRIDLSDTNDHTRVPPQFIDYKYFVPQDDDLIQIKRCFVTYAARMIVTQLHQFKHQSVKVTWHIEHRYSTEMSTKSTIVPLGLIEKNEANIKEMMQIMTEMHKYVPTVAEDITIQTEEGLIHTHEKNVHPILFGGDQLTVARARGAQTAKSSELNAVSRLEGLVPVFEDWHTKMTLLTAIWQRLYRSTEATRGTLKNLRNILNRSAVGQEPSKNVHAVEDFLEVVLTGYVIRATLLELDVNIEEGFENLQQNDIDVISLAEKVVDRLTCLSSVNTQDKVLQHTMELCTMAFIWYHYRDIIREGDGDRLQQLIPLLLQVFRSTQRKNYSKEMVHFILQSRYLMSDRLKTQLLYSRFVNTHGRRGKNVACDLHMEHLNRDLKNFLGDRSSNIVSKDVKHKCARSLRALSTIRQKFGEDSAMRHQLPMTDMRKDVFKTARTLTADIFIDIGRQFHVVNNTKPLWRKKTQKEEADLKEYLMMTTGYKLR